MRIFFGTFLRILAILSAILFFLLFLGFIISYLENASGDDNFTYYKGNPESKNTIALINLKGPIISDPVDLYNFGILANINAIYPAQIEKYLEELSKKDLSGLIISIDSPGGSVSATSESYNLIKNFKKAQKIPIYFHSKNLLASGAYWLSLSGDKIFTNYGALVGSIGVKGPDWIYYNSPTSISSGAFGYSIETKKEIKLFSNTAGESKDLFNPFRSPTKKEIDHLQKMVNDIYNNFLKSVSSSRKIEKTTLINEIGAKIYNSKGAFENNLIDGQKNINQTIKILENDLGLTDKKIIHKNIYNNFFLNNFFIFFKLNNKTNFKNFNDLINSDFCNNLKNQFSVVAKSYNQTSC
tara:strand:- start:1128 stop:2189 length:1062 start_codon:yes stop_codon:yes gene_type:complete